MTNISIQITNAPQFLRSMEQKKTEIQNRVKTAIVESGMLLKEEVKESIQGNRAEPRSVDTGEFLNSIESNPITDGVVVSSDVKQSVFMEYGTSKIEERRHFRNSVDRITPIIIEKVKTEIEAAIK
jgi:hypothetical protein